MGEDDYYITNDKGLEIYQKFTEQQESYVSHFDIYAYVDLQEGVFADPQSDLLEGGRWSDLRVAVAEYKGIDPYRVVFLSMRGREEERVFSLHAGGAARSLHVCVAVRGRSERLPLLRWHLGATFFGAVSHASVADVCLFHIHVCIYVYIYI